MKADSPQPFLSSSLQSDKENVDEKKIGGAISFGKAFLARAEGEWEEKVWGIPLSARIPQPQVARLMMLTLSTLGCIALLLGQELFELGLKCNCLF
jgi:hypothetical protein